MRHGAAGPAGLQIWVPLLLLPINPADPDLRLLLFLCPSLCINPMDSLPSKNAAFNRPALPVVLCCTHYTTALAALFFPSCAAPALRHPAAGGWCRRRIACRRPTPVPPHSLPRCPSGWQHGAPFIGCAVAPTDADQSHTLSRHLLHTHSVPEPEPTVQLASAGINKVLLFTFSPSFFPIPQPTRFAREPAAPTPLVQAAF